MGQHEWSEAGQSEPPRLLEEEEAAEPAVKTVRMRPIDRQCVTRAFVCLGGLIVALAGSGALFAGVFALSASPSLRPDSFGSERADVITYVSIALGSVVLLLGLFGAVGAYQRNRRCLRIFGVAALLLLGFSAGCISSTLETESALDDWSERGYRIRGDEADALGEGAEELLRRLYVEVSAAYAFCVPDGASVGLAKAALDRSAAPPPLRCQRSEIDSTFASWVNRRCFDASRLDHFATVAQCRADLEAGAADGSFAPLADGGAGADASWLFCACAEPLRLVLKEEWLAPVRVGLIALCGFLLLLLLLLCLACRGAGQASRRRKKEELELVMLKEARYEARDTEEPVVGV